MGKFLIGLIFGVAIAIGVVYYLNNSQTQLVSKFTNVPESSVSPTTALLSPGTKIKEVDSSANNQTGASESDFDFYQILQTKDDASASVTESANKPQKVVKYALLAGSFADISAAKDMKARLAFQGYEAKIKVVTDSSGTVNKVILGPYNSQDDAKLVQQDLIGNRIKSTLVQIN